MANMNRLAFRSMAEIRLREAKALLEAGYYDGAYYLLGYAVECALKACISKQTQRHDFLDRQTVNDSYTHKLGELVKVAGLEQSRKQALASDTVLEVNWSLVLTWTEASRYRRSSRLEAEALYSAISNRQHGVMRWLRRHW